MVKVVLLFLVWATSVAAGPWPRGADQTFLSFSLTAEAGTMGLAAYAEHGLSDRTTLVFAASRSRGPPRAMLSLARDLWPDRSWRTGWSLGLGLHDGDAAAQASLSVGRGFAVAGLNGWITATSATTATASEIETRAEATLGLTTGRGLKLWSQLSVTGDMQIRPLLTPPRLSEVRTDLGAALPLGRDTWATVGASQALHGGGATRLSLGIWTEF